MAPIRVALVGAAGETGTSIVNGLLDAGGFDIIALTRPTSVSKPKNEDMKQHGVEIRPLDLKGPQDDLVKALNDIDVVISAIGPQEQLEQIPLATAAKTAGVKRFIPCGFVTVCPPGGVMPMRDLKEVVYNHIRQLYLPYTFLDVGWWYQIAFPRLPSGKIDYVVGLPNNDIAGDGNVPSALTDLRDIGKYVAKIIVDERTLNKMVLAYNELWTPNQVYDLLEKMSGEKLDRKYVSEAELRARFADAEEKLKTDPGNFGLHIQMIGSMYMISWGIRGDNTPEYAKYLGYLDTKELYPDMKFTAFEEYMKQVLAGTAQGVYAELKAKMAASGKWRS